MPGFKVLRVVDVISCRIKFDRECPPIDVVDEGRRNQHVTAGDPPLQYEPSNNPSPVIE